MSLRDRIEAAKETQRELGTPDRKRPGNDRSDPLTEFKQRVQAALFSGGSVRALDTSISEADLKRRVTREIETVIAETGTPLSPEERERVALEISRDIVGFGPIEGFLDDPEVTEVMVNGTDAVYVERAGRLYRTATRFESDEQVQRIIDRIVAKIGRRIDESSPMVDARLADGSRVNAVIPPLSVDGPTLTIRKFARDPFQAHDLERMGTITPEMTQFIKACVEGRLNVLITGGTGTGKTTLLNVLSGFIPEDERIVTIEDAVELQLHQDHVVRLESRPPNIEGRGEITIRDLVRNSLRMRPDRIVVGEVRGAEALDMLQAMNTGHEGSMSTLHSNTPRDGLNRLETMVMMTGLELPIRAIREYISSALNVVVHLSRMRDGSRIVTHVTEISGMESEHITLQEIFRYRHQGIDEEGRPRGYIESTGIRPQFADHLSELGLELPPGVFEGGRMQTADR